MNQAVRCVGCRCADLDNSKCKLTGREVTLEAERHCKKFWGLEKKA